MEVDAPRRQNRAIWEGPFVLNVFFRKDHIAKKLLCLAGAAHIRHPPKARVGVFHFVRILGGMSLLVFDGIPSAEIGAEVPVADEF